MANDLVVIKANSLIEASYRLSIDEIRILALTVGTMDPNSNKQEFEFSVADVVREFPDVKVENAYKQMQVAVKKLYDRSVRTEDSEKVTDFRWVSSRTYFKKEGRFRIALTNEVMPYLTQLKGQFTRYELRNISSFNSVHSIRIYELVTQYKSVGWREIAINDLKQWLQVEDKYPRYNNFKQWVLDPAVTEINEKSDLFITVEPIKRGRKITALKFTINHKKKAETQLDLVEELDKQDKTRKIHGVFVEIARPQVAAGSHAEGEWARKNYDNMLKQMKQEGILKGRFADADLTKFPESWLKVAQKYTKIFNKPLCADIGKELAHRNSKLEN